MGIVFHDGALNRMACTETQAFFRCGCGARKFSAMTIMAFLWEYIAKKDGECIKWYVFAGNFLLYFWFVLF
ncbi:MAG: hypothetical protein KIG22_01395, partial [Oxalobacter sp.]|nr:hypothetical protein [Oxalobacter sp.]